MRFNWLTATDSIYDTTKSGVVYFPAYQTTMQEYVHDLNTRVAWTGIIINPRILPAASQTTGWIEIDYIILQTINPSWIGDVNGDARVDLEDFGVLANNYGNDVIGWEQGDFTGDRKVDFNDITAMASHWLYIY